MNNFKAAVTAPFRAAGRLVMRWGRGRAWNWATLGGSNRDWSRTVQDGGRNNAIVQSCINWVVTAFPEAPTMVYKRDAAGKLEPWADHPLLGLLETPNPYYSGEHLWAATLADRLISGNAYWLKVRAGSGQPVQLWWVPSTLMEPMWPEDDDSVFISHYEYRVDGRTPIMVSPADVVHFRYGFDPANVRKGRSPLAALMREIASDDEAANWTASLLSNMGVPGLVISPEADVELGDEDAEGIKTQFVQRFGGDQRGSPLVLSAAAKVSILAFSPEQMNLTDLRRIPEERISGALGIPAIVAGLGVGLEHATYSNYAQAREAAFEAHIIPTQRLLSAELRTQLVPDFGDPATLRVGFDITQVRALMADQDALHKRIREDLVAGVITRNQALTELGMEPEDGSDVLYVPTTVTPLAVTDLLTLRLQPARVTVPDVGAMMPEPGVDPLHPSEPADPLGIAPPKTDGIAALLGKSLTPEMVAAVLTVLGEKPGAVDAVEHAELVLREARAMGQRNGAH